MEAEKQTNRASVDSETLISFALELVCFGTRLYEDNKEAATYVTASYFCRRSSRETLSALIQNG